MPRANIPWSLVASIVLAVLLSACASQPKPQPTESSDGSVSAPQKPVPKAPELLTEWESYQEVLGTIEQWQVQGKLGVRIPNNSGSVYFNWQQRPNDFAIHLNGPLGQGATWIRGDAQQVSLSQAGKESVSANSPEELMASTMGWWLPVSQLYYWIRAIPAPDSDISKINHNSDGTLHSLEQDGWTLSYKGYQQTDSWHLPAKVIAQRDDTKLTFIIKSWRLH